MRDPTESTAFPDRRPAARSSFEIHRRTRVPAFDAELTQCFHRPTGARHLHLEIPVEDCAFLMGFLTPAPDSSGLTHVLEHLVMCGSERYPCRRAFFAMLGRTLSTTMNALTTEDCTAYHFATRSLADFENLLSVYLDAAFFPRLDRLDFYQEACRVEIEDAGDGRGVPVRRGVVLSEMRGLMNEPEQQLRQALNRLLFPVSPYRFNAGGDPWEIPALGYETLKAYHRRHYHPGNAVFLSAGSLRPEWVQVRLHDLALARLSRRDSSAAAPPASIHVPPIETPARATVRYPVVSAEDRESPGASVALGWRLGDTSDPMAGARAQLLARCLLEQGDAPLRRALLDAPGSPGALLASNGVQATGRRLVLQCGVHGCDADTAGEIESRVLAAIDGVARGGLDPSLVDGALAQIERELRERHDRRYPFALKLLVRMLPATLYGGDPAGAVDALPALAAVRAETRSRDDVGALVRRCLRDNPERVSVIAIPDSAAGRRLEAEDRAGLARTYGSSCRQARNRIAERARALRRRQDSAAGESSLPGLDLEAIGPAREPPELLALPAACLPEAYRRISSEKAGSHRVGGETGHPFAPVRRDPGESAEDGRAAESAGSASIRVSRGPTGGLVYVRLAIDMSGLDPDRLDDIGLLGDILPESAHGGRASGDTRARIARICDQLSVEPWLLARTPPGTGGCDAAAPRAALLLSARARACDEAALVDVLADAKLDARFDRDARTAAAGARARRSKDLARNGHLHAERVAAARLDAWNAVAERWQGPSALAMLDRAIEGDGEGERLEERLHRVHRALAAAPHHLQIVRDREHGASGSSGAVRRDNPPGAPPAESTATCPSKSSAGTEPARREGPVGRRLARSEPKVAAWVVDGPVNYCARVFPAVAAHHPDAGPISVLAAFLGGDLLQRAVRERGGAYGAGARYCDRTATLRMFSYRDPRLWETFRDFELEIERLRREPPAGRRLEEAILRAVRQIDRPRAFQIAARERFLDELQGRSAEDAGALRASVLGTGPERLREVAERYVGPDMGSIGVLAGTGREGDLDRLGITWRCL